MSNFIPSLYIGIGETGALFTLRETYEHVHYGREGVERSVRSFHHFNLSQDPDEAIAKAQGYSEQMGVKLSTTRDQLVSEMREIKRATAEQMNERRIKEEQRQAEWDAQREAWNKERDEKIASGIFTFGPFAGKRFEEAPRGYLTWLMDKASDFEVGSVIRITADAILRLVPHLALPKPDKTAIVGQPKQRLTFDVIVVGSRHFTRAAFSGYGVEVVYVTTMVDKATNACLVVFSGAFNPEEGDELKIKATVKDHDEYKGQAQTIVQRVTVL
jgi:uncharacterized protein (DUF3820 family)